MVKLLMRSPLTSISSVLRLVLNHIYVFACREVEELRMELRKNLNLSQTASGSVRIIYKTTEGCDSKKACHLYLGD